jgi:hemolysin activation/secretion protein
VATLGLSVESVDQFLSGGINQLQIGYSWGIPDFLGSMDEFGMSSNGALSTRIGGSGAQAGGDFGKAMLRYQRLQRISASNSILLRLEAQHSSDLLTSIEQFVMGGPNNVRAYPIAEFLMDKGQFASVEWIVDLLQLFGDGGTNGSFSISAFGDYAHGEVNDPFGDQNPDVDLAGVGIGIAIGHTSNGGNQFSFRIDVSQASTHFDPTNDRDPQYFGQLSYTFR